MIRWLDFNDTWLAAEWGHPSDNLGGILAAADWLSRNAVAAGKPPLTVRDVLTGDDQGARDPGLHRAREQLQQGRPRPRGAGEGRLHRGRRAAARPHARGDRSTRCRSPGSTASRCAPTATRPTPARARAGPRATPPAAPCASRSSRKTGEMGYPSVLTAKTWGFYDVLFKGNAFKFQRPYGSYVMENVLFKISFPAEFHSQTAVEAAMTIHGELATPGQEAARTSGRSPSARTRPASASSTRRARSTIPPTATTASSTWWPCRSSSAASPRRTTRTTVAADPRIDTLRDKIMCVEDQQFTPRLPRPGQALDRQRAHRGVHRRQEAEGDRGRVPDRPQAPPQGGHAGAGREVQDQSRAPLRREAARGHPRRCAWTRSGWRRPPSTSSWT